MLILEAPIPHKLVHASLLRGTPTDEEMTINKKYNFYRMHIMTTMIIF